MSDSVLTNGHGSPKPPQRVAYVVKRYPRFSETFVVNEILAHEAAGTEIHIFALRPAADPYFQPAISQVRAPLTYLPADHIRADMLWQTLQQVAERSPAVWDQLAAASNATGTEVFQSAWLALEVQRRGIEHIHAHFATAATTVARMASLLSQVPYTFTAHAKDIFHEDVDGAELAEKFDGAAAVVTVSDFNVRFLSAAFAKDAHKIRRIYNGLDLGQFEFNAAKARPAKVVAVGRLVEKKGLDDLITACGMLRDAGTHFNCEIIGGGDCEDALRRQVAELALDDMIDLVGPRPLTYVQNAIREAAVFVVPSVTASTGDRDGLPTVLLEAMALGTPVVATSVTGIPEAIVHEQSGVLVAERRPEELAAAIKRLLADSDLRVRLATAARKVVEQHFEVHRNAAELRRVFADCRRADHPNLALAEVG